MDSRLTTHTHTAFLSLDSYHYPSLHPPFGSDPLYRSWPITQSHPCSLHLSLSLFGISTAFTLNTHTLLYTLGDTFRDAGLSLTPTSHLVLLFSPALHTACVLCLRFALLFSLPHFLFYSLPTSCDTFSLTPFPVHVLMHYSVPFYGIHSVSSVCAPIIPKIKKVLFICPDVVPKKLSLEYWMLNALN